MPWDSGSILILTFARSEGGGVTSGVLSSIFMLGAGICSGAGSAAGTCSHSGMGSELHEAKTGYHSLEQQDAYSLMAPADNNAPCLLTQADSGGAQAPAD